MMDNVNPKGSSANWAEPRTLAQVQATIAAKAMNTPTHKRPAKIIIESNPSKEARHRSYWT